MGTSAKPTYRRVCKLSYPPDLEGRPFPTFDVERLPSSKLNFLREEVQYTRLQRA